MSEESENARKHHQYPPPKVSPPGRSVNQSKYFTLTREDLISSTPRSRDPRIHASAPWLDLSNQSAQPSPSQEIPSQYSAQFSSTYYPLSNHINFGDHNLLQPQPPPPSSGGLYSNPSSPTTGSPYVPDSPTLPKYPPLSTTKHSDGLAASSIQRLLSPTPSGPPGYSLSSTYVDAHYTSYQLPSASGSSLPPPQAQPAALPISHESSLPRKLPDVPNSNNSSSSSKRRSQERHGDSASLSGYSAAGLSGSLPSTPLTTSNGIWQSPGPPGPPAPNGFSRSRSSQIYPVLPIVQSAIQSNDRDGWSDEGAFGLSEDYKKKGATSVPKAPPEKFFYPPGRSPAHPPEKSSKPKSPPKSPIRSSKSKDDNSGRLRIVRDFFKRKDDKGKNIPPEMRVPEESSHEFNVHQERIRTLKSSYPLDPYNSVLLDDDRRTGELLSRLNRTGSPSFHNYTIPPLTVLDLGCGQGHWVLEAAMAWKAYGTHVTGYDMVDISSSWAAEGVGGNINFKMGNFLKESLPFNDNTFDLVRMSCLALCITLDSWGYILREVCRVMVADGRLEFIDDQIFLPYSKVSSLMEGHDDASNRKGKARERLPTTQRSIVLSPKARSLSISDLDALFERMLFDTFDIYRDPSDIILPLMKKIFGQAEEVETMKLVLAPPDSTANSGRFPQQGPRCPGLILCPSTLIPMDHSEVEIHASKHLRTLLSCKNFLAQHAVKAAELEGERIDEESISQALYNYEIFLRHRFNNLQVPAPGSLVIPDELTHVRTFRVFEAIKLAY